MLIEVGSVSGKCSVLDVKFFPFIRAVVALVGIAFLLVRGPTIRGYVSNVLVGAAVAVVTLDVGLIKEGIVLNSVPVVVIGAAVVPS